MKQKNMKSILIKTAIIAGTFLFGSAIGVVAMRQYALHYGVYGNGINEVNQLITDRVAIVNLDEGVMVQDEKVNYAEKLIINLDENFSFTGLEDARQGYATGIYAGYLIIPATFSESIVSLNNTPVRSEISYAINSNLREDVKEEVIYDVLALMDDINDGVSYMYLHSVLDDFHTAQDAADTVMNNDIEERETIDAIQANDLVALVPVAEFTEIENNIEPVDVSEYMAKNIELTGEVGLKYTEYLMESEEEHFRINEEAFVLMEEMGNMSSIMSNSNFSQNGDGDSVYQDGMEELDTLFEDYNISLEEKETEIEENVIAIYKDINTYLTEYDRAVEAYQTEHEKAYRNTLDALEVLFEKYSSSYVIVSVEEMQEIEDTLEIQQNLIQELQSDSYEEDEFESPEDKSEDMEIEEELESEEEWKIEEELESEEEWKIEGESESEENTEEFGVMQQLRASSTDMYETSLCAATVESEPLSALQTEILKTLNDNYYFFSGYLLSEEGEVVKDEDNESVLLTSLIEEYRQDLDDPLVKAEILEKEIGEIEKMDSSDIRVCIDENVLGPIQESVNEFVTEVMAQYEVEQEQMMTYNEAIMEYDPLKYINYDEIQTLTNSMSENGIELSEAIIETDIQQMEYVADVYTATREDLFTLQDNIVQAKEDSDKAVEEGLQELKDTKDANSEQNQEILYDFSRLLPYTRLGSLEYVQAYEFMVNPVSAVNTEADGKGANIRTDSVRVESDSVNVEMKKREDFQNISILICLVICVIIVSTTIKYHFHKKDESYELE